MVARTLEHWVDDLQAHGKYTLLRADAVHGSGLSPDAVKRALGRLAHRGRLVKVKDYFYVVTPLEYLNAGGPPPSWFIQDLMAAMKLPYYVGLLSAAALHGAAHQQPQEFQVITDRSVRPVTAGRTRVRFFASKYIAGAATVNMKTPTGTMRVATPETTAVDLVRFNKAAGHLGYVATVVAELAPSIDAKKLLAALRLVDDLPNAQRLGHILDHVHARRLSDPIHAWVERQGARQVPLQSGQSLTGGRLDRRWHVLVNQPLEMGT